MPDGRYFVVRGRLWRMSNPALPKEERAALTKSLMDARRSIRDARAPNDLAREQMARTQVQSAKVALGERGAVRWNNGAPDYNRHMAEKAASLLADLGYNKVHVLHGDGTKGWPDHTPYDGIIVNVRVCW